MPNQWVLSLDSFNPCFNGYTTSTYNDFNKKYDELVSFNPCFNGYTTSTKIENQ